MQRRLSSKLRLPLAVLALLGSATGTTFLGVHAASAGKPHPTGADFNGDGYADMAIGAPYSSVGGVAKAGVVHVLYGGPNGLRTDNEQFLSEATPGINGNPSDTDAFGFRLAHGDLNGDGFDDLAVGMPYETVGGVQYAGG